MKLKLSFDDFIKKINLDDTRTGKIQTAHNAVREFLEKEEDIRNKYYETFLQGSYRLCTAVRPQGEGEYDVDVILSLNLDNGYGVLRNPDEVIAWVVTILKKSDRYKDKIEAKTKCVRLNYADGFHMDIVPAHCSGDLDAPLKVPYNWNESHPKGFRKWCVKKHSDSNNFFYPIVKILKWWRNIHFGDDGNPKSILLTTLIGNNIVSDCDSLDDSLIRTMEKLNTYFQTNILVPVVNNPVLATENISKSWNFTDYLDFRLKFKKATEKARMAYEKKDEEDTIKLWNSEELFKDTFPKTIRNLGEQERLVAAALTNNLLSINSLGNLAFNPTPKSIPVPQTRFFGEKNT